MSFLPPINQNQRSKIDFFNFDNNYEDKLNSMNENSDHENFNDFYEKKKI
jgi:hypothetical protein